MDRPSKTVQTKKPIGPATDRRRDSRQLTPPRYQQIVEELRKEIGNDTLKAGDVLPSESRAAASASLSAGTPFVRRFVRCGTKVLSSRGKALPRRITKPENGLLYTYSVSDVAELLQYATEVKYEIDKTSVVVADAESGGTPVLPGRFALVAYRRISLRQSGSGAAVLDRDIHLLGI